MELQGRASELRQKGLGLAAISYDPPSILAAFSRQRGITFPLLSDEGSATIRRFGLLNTLVEDALGSTGDDPVLQADVRKYVTAASPRPGANMAGMAFPGTFILDRRGRVTSRFFEELYFERHTASSLMLTLEGGASVPGTRISASHIDIAAYASDGVVSAGNRFSLAVDIEPHRRIHVYAPGASSYRTVALQIDPQPFVKVLPLRYPASEIYFFQPLKERVPVYQKPFTLVQDVLLEGSAQAQAALRGRDVLTISGTLEYQACDDKVCFNPAEVPLSWTVALRPLVFERPARPQ